MIDALFPFISEGLKICLFIVGFLVFFTLWSWGLVWCGEKNEKMDKSDRVIGCIVFVLATIGLWTIASWLW